MWFGLYGRFLIRLGEGSWQQPQHEQEGPLETPWWVLVRSPARMGSRAAQGAWQRRGGQDGRPSSAAEGKQGVHAMAKAAALSQLVIFMRQHLLLSTQQQISQKAAHGGCESHAGPWDPGQSRGLQGGLKRGMNGVLGENGNPLAPRPALLRGVPCSR